MKITMQELKRIIKEELEEARSSRITRSKIRGKAMEMIKQSGGISSGDLISGLTHHFEGQLDNPSDFDDLEEMVQDVLETKVFDRLYNVQTDTYSTKPGARRDRPKVKYKRIGRKPNSPKYIKERA